MDRLLYAFPGLKWSPALLAALCASLSKSVEEDDGAVPVALPEDGRSAARSGSLQRLKWVSGSLLQQIWV